MIEATNESHDVMSSSDENGNQRAMVAVIAKSWELVAPFWPLKNLIAVNPLQAFFDDGQSTLAMPLRRRGLYGAWKELAQWDERLHRKDETLVALLRSLLDSPVLAIERCLTILKIAPMENQRFFELLLLTLPGWAAHLKYPTDWTADEPRISFPVTKEDYLAMRVIITTKQDFRRTPWGNTTFLPEVWGH